MSQIEVRRLNTPDEKAILVAEDAAGRELGRVMILPAGAPHRAEIAGLWVEPDARGRGVGALLLRFAEGQAVVMDRSVVLAGVPAAAETLLRRGGWSEAGVVPDFGLAGEDELYPARLFWKVLA